MSLNMLKVALKTKTRTPSMSKQNSAVCQTNGVLYVDNNLRYYNSGAAGSSGWHRISTYILHVDPVIFNIQSTIRQQRDILFLNQYFHLLDETFENRNFQIQ